jgi:hypothetical protein
VSRWRVGSENKIVGKNVTTKQKKRYQWRKPNLWICRCFLRRGVPAIFASSATSGSSNIQEKSLLRVRKDNVNSASGRERSATGFESDGASKLMLFSSGDDGIYNVGRLFRSRRRYGLWTLDCGLWTLDCRLWISVGVWEIKSINRFFSKIYTN